ncbi:MAG: cytochrome c peroxidase [Planctomycetota bacterium]|jgi:cytochrome c peroxidase
MRILALLALSAAVTAQGGGGGGGGGGGPPQPLPPRPVPAQNPITPQKAMLGKLLFWEEQMSADNRVACGTCHTFSAGGGDARRARGVGADGVLNTPDDVFASPGIIRSDAANDYTPDLGFGFSRQVTGRSSPTFLTGAWFSNLFWDGRARGNFVDPDTGVTLISAGGALENQALGPILSSVEMAHDSRSFSQAVSKLEDVKPMALATNLPVDMATAVAGNTTYPDLFQAAFGTSDVTAARIAMAIATYERTLVPDQTPYDAFVAGNTAALTAQQVNGLNVFMGPARCVICHTTGLFADDQFHNLGLRPIAEDNGRQGVTGNPAHAGRFKTPSLRNIGLRNTFMHNGQFTNIGDVFTFYRLGGGPNLANKDPQIIPLNVPPNDANDLINFLTNGLTDPRVANSLPPFDRPTLRSQVLSQLGNQNGIPTMGSGNRFPVLLSNVPANLGNIDFKVGVHNALGGAPSTLVLTTASGLSQLSGIWINLGLNGSELLIPWVLDGAAGVPGAGYGTLSVALPNAPFLAGLSLHTQWFVWDGGAPAGAAATRGGRLDLF